MSFDNSAGNEISRDRADYWGDRAPERVTRRCPGIAAFVEEFARGWYTPERAARDAEFDAKRKHREEGA